MAYRNELNGRPEERITAARASLQTCTGCCCFRPLLWPDVQYHGAAYLFHKFFIIDSVHIECKRTILFVILSRRSSMQPARIHGRRMYIQRYRAAIQVAIARSTSVSVYSNVRQR